MLSLLIAALILGFYGHVAANESPIRLPDRKPFTCSICMGWWLGLLTALAWVAFECAWHQTLNLWPLAALPAGAAFTARWLQYKL